MAQSKRSKQDRAALQEAYVDASRAASRAGLLGSAGFGVALIMGVRIAGSGEPLLTPGLEGLLLFGGIAGGIAFTVIALRASAMARRCRDHLEQRRSKDM